MLQWMWMLLCIEIWNYPGLSMCGLWFELNLIRWFRHAVLLLLFDLVINDTEVKYQNALRVHPP